MKDIATKIEGFGFDYNMTMGIGGGMAMRVFPIVLFKDGQVLEDIEGLSFAAGLDAHKPANADDWTRWRREGGKLQTQTSKGWENLPFTAIYSKLPDGFKLNGRFQSLGGGGNTAYGGSDFVAAWSTFDFLPDGRVVKGGGAGGYSSFQSATSAFSSVAPDRRGKYRISGLTHDIAYDNGGSESFLIVTDPRIPTSSGWTARAIPARTDPFSPAVALTVLRAAAWLRGDGHDCQHHRLAAAVGHFCFGEPDHGREAGLL